MSGKLTVERMVAAAKAGVRSGVYDWFWKNYAEFTASVGNGPINWEALAEEFKKDGITASKGVPASKNNVRQIFYRVREDKEGKRDTWHRQKNEPRKKAEPVVEIKEPRKFQRAKPKD